MNLLSTQIIWFHFLYIFLILGDKKIVGVVGDDRYRDDIRTSGNGGHEVGHGHT